MDSKFEINFLRNNWKCVHSVVWCKHEAGSTLPDRSSSPR